MKSRVALLCVAVFGFALLVGCAPKASTTYDVASNHENAKQYKEAIAKYDDYVKTNPSSMLVPFALYHKGVCYEKLYNKPAAMEAYKTAVQQYPQTDAGQWAKLAMEDLEKRELVAPTTTTTTMKPKPTTTTTVKPPKPTTTTTVKPVTTTTLKVVPK